MREKIIRDPVHDVIAFRLDRPVDRLLFQLVNAVEFQRLRRVRQLGMASLAYPGADHSRYSHSLGVMETARKMLEQLGRSFYISEDQQMICLAGALLHDLGHGPFSHVFERVSGIHHEHLTQRMIVDPDSEVHERLSAIDRELPQRVIEVLAGAHQRSYLNDILSSQLDADRLDYLLRDNLMTGSQYGGYDLRWLLHALTIDQRTNRLAVVAKGISAVEAYLQSRFHMYRNVYFHKVVRAGEGMVRLALQRAKRLAVQDRLNWPQRDHPVTKALLGQRLETEEFVDLDDISILQCFKQWMQSDDRVLAGLCHGLLFRRLYKTIDLSRRTESEAREQFVRAESAVKNAGGDVGYDLFLDEAHDTPYEPFTEGQSTGIMVQLPDGQSAELSTLSTLPNALNQQLGFRRLHVRTEMRHVVERALM